MFRMELHNQNYNFPRFDPNLTSVLNCNSSFQFPSTPNRIYQNTLSKKASQIQGASSTHRCFKQNQPPFCKQLSITKSIQKIRIRSIRMVQKWNLLIFLQILMTKIIKLLRANNVIEDVIIVGGTNTPIRKIRYVTSLSIIICLWLVPTVSGTNACGIADCTTCDGVYCTQCDDFFCQSTARTSCLTCLDPNCKTCTSPYSPNRCSVCSDNYYRTSLNNCCPCSIPLCTTCILMAGGPQCTSCDPTYFLNTGAICALCSASTTNCNSCTSTGVCTNCDSGYTLVSASGSITCQTCISVGLAGCTQCSDNVTCAQCQTSQYFLRAGDTTCSLCTSSILLPNCYICEYAEAYCHTCVLNYTMASGSTLCQPCDSVLPNCASCNTTSCSGCDVGWAFSGGACVPCSGINAKCIVCSPGVCTTCLVGYYIFSSTICSPCSTPIPQCLSCSNSSACTNCSDGYGVHWNGTVFDCKPCVDMMSSCISCKVNGTCLSCNITNGTFLDTNTNLCVACAVSLLNCKACQDINVCDACVSSLYALNSSLKCQVCSTFMTACLACNSSSICTSCVLNFFFLNTTDSQCYYCNSSQLQCRECLFLPSLAMQCTLCQAGFHLDYYYQCVCDVGKAIDGFCINVVGCISATSGPNCTNCRKGMTLINQKCVCQTGFWLVTDQCTNVTGCVAVKSASPISICVFCDLTAHFELGVDCQCHCNTYYENVDDICSEVCGDGVLLSLPCDDGNTESGDGCSSKCALESGFKCTVENKTSKCTYSGKLNINLLKVEKIENFNSGRFIFEFKPAISTLNNMNWSNFVNGSVPGANFTLTRSVYKNGKLYVNFNFGSNIEGLLAEMSLSFDSNLFSIGGYNFTFPIKSDGARFAFTTKLETYKLMEYIFLALGGVALLVFAVSLPFHKMLGVETLQAFQIVFTSLLVIEDYEQVYKNLGALGYTLGFGKFWKYDDDVALNTKLLYNRLGVVRQFIQNGVLIIPITIITSAIFIIYFIQYLRNTQLIHKLDSYLESLKSQCSKWYRWLTFPIVIGFSYGSFLALYAQTTNTKEWKSETYQEQSNIISVQANICLILAFYFIYSYVFWSEVFNPQSSQISKALLSVERAKRWYLSQYLIYSFALMSLFIAGYQNSSCMGLFLLSSIVTIQLLIVVFARPYHEGIHLAGIILNQAALTAICLCQLIRELKLKQGQTYSEDDNFYLVILSMALLGAVDGVSIVRLISAIRVKFKKKQRATKPLKNESMREQIRKAFINEPKQLSLTIGENKYLMGHQTMQYRKQIWREVQKKRVLNDVGELDQD